MYVVVEASTLFTKYYWSEQINRDEVGRACSTYGKDDYLQNFSWKYEEVTWEI
jgi:hypothetical protein